MGRRFAYVERTVAEGIDNGNSSPVRVDDLRERSIVISGTFNGATVTVQIAVDKDIVAGVPAGPFGSFGAGLTALGAISLPACFAVRINVAGGGGSESITATLGGLQYSAWTDLQTTGP